MTAWELRQEPHRHYRRLRDDGKWAWDNRDRTRIASVTTVLDGDIDWLLSWAVGKALVAAEAAVGANYFGLHEAEASFIELVEATGLMPDTYRDLKGDIGTAGHAYLEHRLAGWDGPASAMMVMRDPELSPLPYGYRAAIDAFVAETGFRAAVDERGQRVERAVGDEARAVAGTYDAQGSPTKSGPLHPGVHRIDLKSSNTLQPKFLAQLACYERMAVLCGEERSDWLTLIHIDACGNWRPVQIPTGGPEEEAALADFDAALARYRLAPTLRKLLLSGEPPTELGDL